MYIYIVIILYICQAKFPDQLDQTFKLRGASQGIFLAGLILGHCVAIFQLIGACLLVTNRLKFLAKNFDGHPMGYIGSGAFLGSQDNFDLLGLNFAH